MNSIANLSPQQLRNAAELQEQILSLQGDLQNLLGSGFGSPTASPAKRRLSAKGLANIREGARKRWGTSAVRKRKSKMSAAGRARIATALKKRWAAAKRAGRNTL